jgi:hypothetical protein
VASSVTIRQRAAHSRLRRLRYWLSRLAGTRLAKSQRVYIVTIDGQRFKRIIQQDASTAASIERTLTRYGESERVPGVVIHYEREIWVDFVPGEALSRVDDDVVCRVADFFAELYARDTRLVKTAETDFPLRLRRNLRFLHRVGVLDATQHDDLQRAAQRLAPDAVWVGFDYTDAVLKNFVAAEDDGRVCAIDVESIAADELIGVGFAKAAERWLGSHREAFLHQLQRPSVPDFRPYASFVELYFLAHWMQRAFMERKWQFVDAARLTRFCEAPAPQADA